MAADFTVALDASGAYNVSVGEAVASSADNCAVASVTLDRTEFSCSDVGSSFTVTATATDTSGNQATDSVSVSVVDTTVPTLTSVGTFNVTLNATGLASVSVASLVSSSGDNCGVSVTADKTVFSCADAGANVVTLTAVDPSGNNATTTVTVFVSDDEVPSVAASANFTVALDASGAYNVSVGEAVASSADNCAVASVTLDRTEFSCSDVGSSFTVTAGC